MTTGTRTQVAETLRSGIPRILRDSLRTLSSSLRPAAVLARARPRHDVERQRRGEGRRRSPSLSAMARRTSPAVCPSERSPATDLELVVQAVDAGLARAGGRLVGGHDQLAQAPAPVQGAERVDHGQGRAVRVAMMPRGRSRAWAGLTSGTTSGTSGSIRNAPELSTTTAPRVDRDGRPLAPTPRRGRRTSRRRRRRRPRARAPDLDLLPAHREPLARRTRRRDQTDLAPDVRSRRQDASASPCRRRRSHRRRPELACGSSSSRPSVDHGLDLLGVQPERRVDRTDRRRRRRPPG